MSKSTSVVVIDDSAFMRKSISMMLESDPTIKVVATARDGQDGVQKVKEFKPDIVTLDVEMPVMDGITALKTIMRECPTPVLMISSITTEGAKVTLDALTAGAIDFIAKDRSFVSVQIASIRDELLAKVHEITSSRLVQLSMRRGLRNAGARPSPSTTAATSHVARPSHSISKNYVSRTKNELKAVVLGISTGGPFALLQMLPKIRGNFPVPIAIVQHMPPNFTKSMAERLDAQCELNVHEAADGDVMKPGTVLIAPGGQHLVFQRRGDTIIARITTEPKSSLYKPCADVMMLSAVDVFRSGLLGVIMTGMGKDGLEGLRAIKQHDGYVLAQGEESCIVYGMPKAAVEDGIADAIVPLDGIAEAIMQIVSGKFAVAA